MQIMSRSNEWVLNLVFRLLNLTFKFFIIIFLVKALSEDDFGSYGVLISLVTYFVYFLGFDLYNYYNRELIRNKDGEKRVINSVIKIYCFGYLFLFPFVVLNSHLNLLQKDVVSLFLVLVIVEHINQEIYRYLILNSKQLISSILLFFRQSLWVLPLVAINFSGRPIDLRQAVISMIVMSLVALTLGLAFSHLHKMISTKEIIKKLDKGWLITVAKITLPLLIATLCIRTMLTLDRIFIEKYLEEYLASYVFFAMISNSLVTIYDAALFSYYMPHVVSLGDTETERATKLVNSTLLKVIGIGAIFFVIALFVVPVLLNIIGKENILLNIEILFFCIFSMILFGVSQVFNYALYAKGRDKEILLSNIMGMLIFVLIIFVLAKRIEVVLIAMMLGFAAILIFKYGFYRKCILN